MSRVAVFCRVILPLFLLLLSGCSTFERDWQKAAMRPERDPFAGRWEGKWRSAKHRNGEGRLRCVLTPIAPERYQANFKADWMIFTSTYSTIFEAQRKGREITFRGSENLGPLFGGSYTFAGKATPERFSATYDSSYDTGTFEMLRPGRSNVASALSPAAGDGALRRRMAVK